MNLVMSMVSQIRRSRHIDDISHGKLYYLHYLVSFLLRPKMVISLFPIRRYSNMADQSKQVLDLALDLMVCLKRWCFVQFRR